VSLASSVVVMVTPARITGPAAIDGIGPADAWQGYWQKTEVIKRQGASWTNGH